MKRLFTHTTQQPPSIDGFQAIVPLADGPELLVSRQSREHTAIAASIADLPPDTWQSMYIKEESSRSSRAAASAANLIKFDAEDLIREDVYGITFAIDYEDALGIPSSRRITLYHLYMKNGNGYLRSFCHERQAPRTFRFDRIRAVIDADGVVHDPALFFSDELSIDFLAIVEQGYAAASFDAEARTTPSETVEKGKSVLARVEAKPGLAQRHEARDGLRVLVALARCDGQLHNKEVDVVIDYIEEVCIKRSVLINELDRRALVPYLKRQRPDIEVLTSCLERLEAQSLEDRRLFMSHAVLLAQADGVLQSEEFSLLRDIQSRLNERGTATHVF